MFLCWCDKLGHFASFAELSWQNDLLGRVLSGSAGLSLMVWGAGVGLV